MNIEERIKALEEKRRLADMSIRKLRVAQEKKNRAIETRKKILAGAALLNQYEKSDEKMKDYFEKLLKSNLNPKDFEFLFPENSKSEDVA